MKKLRDEDLVCTLKVFIYCNKYQNLNTFSLNYITKLIISDTYEENGEIISRNGGNAANSILSL